MRINLTNVHFSKSYHDVKSMNSKPLIEAELF
jgi:hypothetical protein